MDLAPAGNNIVFQCDAGEGRNIFFCSLEGVRIMGFYDLSPVGYFSVSREGEN